jgi:hypothetical protein
MKYDAAEFCEALLKQQELDMKTNVGFWDNFSISTKSFREKLSTKKNKKRNRKTT